jgi:hypothetical protein
MAKELKARFFASLRMTAEDLALPMEVADGEGTQSEILRFAQDDSARFAQNDSACIFMPLADFFTPSYAGGAEC